MIEQMTWILCGLAVQFKLKINVWTVCSPVLAPAVHTVQS